MTTATVSSDVNQQILELTNEAALLQSEARVKLAEAQERYAKIRDLANRNSGEYEVGSSNGSPKATTPKKTVTGGAAKTGGAKKKVAKKKGGKKKGPVSASERNYDNKKTLGKAISDILDREEWPALDLPEGAEGLTAGDIKKLLEIEGDWTSSSADPGNQISAQLSKFKKAGQIARGDGRRYYIVDGAVFR